MNAPEPGPDRWINRNLAMGASLNGHDSVITANALLPPIDVPPNSTVHAARSVTLPGRL